MFFHSFLTNLDKKSQGKKITGNAERKSQNRTSDKKDNDSFIAESSKRMDRFTKSRFGKEDIQHTFHSFPVKIIGSEHVTYKQGEIVLGDIGKRITTDKGCQEAGNCGGSCQKGEQNNRDCMKRNCRKDA